MEYSPDFHVELMADLSKETGPLKVPAKPAKPNMTGKEVTIGLNSYQVTAFPTQMVHQYDVGLDLESPVR